MARLQNSQSPKEDNSQSSILAFMSTSVVDSGSGSITITTSDFLSRYLIPGWGLGVPGSCCFHLFSVFCSRLLSCSEAKDTSMQSFKLRHRKLSNGIFSDWWFSMFFLFQPFWDESCKIDKIIFQLVNRKKPTSF